VKSQLVAEDKQLSRKNRLLEILEKGLPPFQHTVLELMSVLNDPGADFKKAAKPIQTDPTLSAQVLRICNSPLFGRRSRVISIEQAVALLGWDRLRSLTMTSSLAGFAGQGLPKDQVASFWKHSFLAAMLSKHLSEYRGFAEPEQAYIAGLLHDIGQVPQWMLIARERSKPGAEIPNDWLDYPSAERGYFGIDHCELGSQMAEDWGLMPSFVDVILKHHEPAEAEHDPYLVEIVALVEHFLLAREDAMKQSSQAESSPEAHQPVSGALVTERCSLSIAESDWLAISDTLNREYDRLLPHLDASVASMIGGAG
jgi:HD-like signal output (HDOD) protein